MALHFDAETDGLYDKVTKLHCLVIYDDKTDKTYICDPQNLDFEVGIRLLLNADVICGHNIIDYDIPVIEKLYPWAKFDKEYGVNYLDTLVLTRVTYPDIKSSDFGRVIKGILPSQRDHLSHSPILTKRPRWFSYLPDGALKLPPHLRHLSGPINPLG